MTRIKGVRPFFESVIPFKNVIQSGFSSYKNLLIINGSTHLLKSIGFSREGSPSG